MFDLENTAKNPIEIDINSIVKAAIWFCEDDLERHTAAVVEANCVTYQHVWEFVRIPELEALFATSHGLILVKKENPEPNPRGVPLILREITPEEADQALETPELSKFIARYQTAGVDPETSATIGSVA